MLGFKNRHYRLKEKVKVYLNLHKNLFSVVALTGENKGKVIAHLDILKLSECEFKVNNSGKKLFDETGVKNVHAFVTGYLESTDIEELEGKYQNIRYNPKDSEYFAINGKPIIEAREVYFIREKAWIKL
jgi:hypothetical protein